MADIHRLMIRIKDDWVRDHFTYDTRAEAEAYAHVLRRTGRIEARVIEEAVDETH